MSTEPNDDKAPIDYYQFLPIAVAGLLTAAAVGLCFFSFNVPVAPPQQAPASQNAMSTAPGEIIVSVPPKAH